MVERRKGPFEDMNDEHKRQCQLEDIAHNMRGVALAPAYLVVMAGRGIITGAAHTYRAADEKAIDIASKAMSAYHKLDAMTRRARTEAKAAYSALRDTDPRMVAQGAAVATIMALSPMAHKASIQLRVDSAYMKDGILMGTPSDIAISR